MLELASLSVLNDQTESLLHSKNLNDPALKVNLRKAKIGIYSNPNFENESNDYLSQAARFSELNLLFELATRNSKAFETAIGSVKFFQQNGFGQQKTPHYSIMVAIQLLFLLSSNRSEEFFTKLETLSSADLTDPHIKYVLLINDAIEEGNYGKVFQLKKQNPLEYFTPFLDQISQTVRTEIAKSAEKAYAYITLKQALSFFQVESQGELRNFIGKFQEGQEDSHIQWVIAGDRILFEKDSKQKIKFNSEDLIAKSLDYAIELEKIA